MPAEDQSSPAPLPPVGQSPATKKDGTGVTVWYEQLREQYRPAQLEVLLIGESPPSRSTTSTAASPKPCMATTPRWTWPTSRPCWDGSRPMGSGSSTPSTSPSTTSPGTAAGRHQQSPPRLPAGFGDLGW
jgi:hypothetical protein